MTEGHPGPPPGWYEDPAGLGQHRYWDGRRWTDGVAVDGRVEERPLPPPGTTAPARRFQAPDLPARAGLVALVGFVAGMGSALVVGLAGAWLGAPRVVVLVASTAVLWTGLLGSCRRVSRRYGTGRVGRDFGVGLHAGDVGFGILMGLAARAAAAFVFVLFLLGPDRLTDSGTGIVGEFDRNALEVVTVALIAVAGAPLVEELYFRGVVLGSLATALGTPLAVVVQAVLFGLAHAAPVLGLANVSVVAVVAAAGIVLGVTARWRRRLATAVVAHGVFNLVAVVATVVLT